MLNIDINNWNVIQKNALLFLSYYLLYTDFIDICQKNYSDNIKKRIIYLTEVY